MNKFKGWIKKIIFELLKSDINDMFFNLMSEKCINDNSKEDSEFKNEIKFSDLIGHKIEIRHYTQEESIFINVEAIVDSSSYVRDENTGSVLCKSRKLILIDTDKTVYNLSNVYEYEIRKREVLHKWMTCKDKDFLFL